MGTRIEFSYGLEGAEYFRAKEVWRTEKGLNDSVLAISADSPGDSI